jgi:hypothetical protein
MSIRHSAAPGNAPNYWSPKENAVKLLLFQELANILYRSKKINTVKKNTLLNKNIITEHIPNELWCNTISRRIKDQDALDLQSRHLVFLLVPSAAVFC